MAIPAFVSDALSEVNEWEGRTEFPPGPQLAILLSGKGLTELSDVELVEAAKASRRQAAWAQSRQLTLLAELSRRRWQAAADPTGPAYRTLEAGESVVEEVSAAPHVTGNAAAMLLTVGERLAQDLPTVANLLEAGRIDFDHARIICDAVVGLPADLIRLFEAAVAGDATAMTTGQLRHRVRTVLQALDPEAYQSRKRRSEHERRMQLWDTPSGTTDLALLDLPAEQAHAIHNKITAVATAMRADGDQRSLDQLRADLATALLQGATLPEAARTLLTDLTEDPTPESPPQSARTDGGACLGERREEAVERFDRRMAETLGRVAERRLGG